MNVTLPKLVFLLPPADARRAHRASIPDTSGHIGQPPDQPRSVNLSRPRLSPSTT